jgi:anaerobic selenocysteine-containing dehydrogenase
MECQGTGLGSLSATEEAEETSQGHAGMLPMLHTASAAMQTGQAVCPYCGVGCVVGATVFENRIGRISADKSVAPNFGMLCPKGVYLRDIFDEKHRLAYPMIRRHRGMAPTRVTWEEAVSFLAERMGAIREKAGKDSTAFYGSGQLDTEASYLFTKLFKGYLGTNNMDTNSRLCMSSAVAAYVRSFGSDGPAGCYADIPEAGVILVIGANMAENHPVLFQMIRKARSKSSNMRIVVIDPRRTKTAEFADVHVPLAPGSDVAFLQLVAKRLLSLGRIDKRFIRRSTEGFEGYRKFLQGLDDDALLSACNIHPARVAEVVEYLTEPCRLLSFYCQGTNQSVQGVDKCLAIHNLHLQLGEIGKRGSGPFSLTGQPNAMGGREAGYLSHQLPGYRSVANDSHRAYLEGAWGIPPGRISSRPGLSAVRVFQAAARGEVKALWIAATNPAVTLPDVKVAREGLRKAELVIVQDCYFPTETAVFADVLLPAAQWGEKVGTMTNSERLVLRSVKFLDPPGEARPDWWIAAEVARAMGLDGFGFSSAEEVWDEFRRLTAGTPCDMVGMLNPRLEKGPLRWPCPHPQHPGTERRYTDGKFPAPSGRARFHPAAHRPPDEDVDGEFPMGFTTGRIASQWHTRTRTGKVKQLVAQEPVPFIEIHPEDAARSEVSEGEWIYLVSRRGRICGRARITKGIRKGLLFMPFHWGELYHPETNVNRVTNPALDPVSEQPELKFCAVRIERGGSGTQALHT